MKRISYPVMLRVTFYGKFQMRVAIQRREGERPQFIFQCAGINGYIGGLSGNKAIPGRLFYGKAFHIVRQWVCCENFDDTLHVRVGCSGQLTAGG
jgi:hypothetical protein